MQRKILFFSVRDEYGSNYIRAKSPAKTGFWRISCNAYKLQEGFTDIDLRAEFVDEINEKKAERLLKRGLYYGRPVTKYTHFSDFRDTSDFTSGDQKVKEIFASIRSGRGWEVV